VPQHTPRRARVCLWRECASLLHDKSHWLDDGQHLVQRKFNTPIAIMLKVPQQRTRIGPDAADWEKRINDFEIPQHVAGSIHEVTRNHCVPGAMFF